MNPFLKKLGFSNDTRAVIDIKLIGYRQIREVMRKG